jgi:tripartite-type tricarboxylate transporter receptor subunit TctC
MTMKALAALIAGAALLQSAGSARSDAIEDFYRNKAISIIVPFGPGGTSHDYATLAAQYLGRHIPGNPRVIVQSMPGAGGIRAAVHAYAVAPRDGTVIFFPADSIAVSQKLQPNEAKYDATKFAWLGTISQTRGVVVVRGDTGVKTVADMKTKEIFMASSGTGSQTEIYPALANGLIGTKMKIVKGFDGSATAMLAIESGEMQGTVNTWQVWRRRPDWFQSGYLRPILQFGLGREPEISDVPNLIDLVDSPDDKQIVKFVSSLGPIGRGLALPPGLPSDRRIALQTAFKAMIEDPVFLAQAKKMDLPVDPLFADDVERFVTDVLGTSSEAVARARTLIYGQ